MKDIFKIHKIKVLNTLKNKVKKAIKNDTYSFFLLNKANSKEYTTLVNNCIDEFNNKTASGYRLVCASSKRECNEDTRWHTYTIIRIKVDVMSTADTKFLDADKKVNW